MIKELRLQKEKEDENKLLEAIHRQAKEGYYFEKGKRYLKKAQKKNTNKLLEFIVCSVLWLVPVCLWLWILLVVLK